MPSPAHAAGSVDVNCTPGLGGGFAIVSSGATWAQTFTAGKTSYLLAVEAKNLGRAAGGSGGPVDVKLYGTSSGTPVLPVLASTQIPAAEMVADNAYRTYTAEFDPASAPLLTNGTLYALGLSTADTAQNSWGVGVNTCPGTVYLQNGGTFGTFGFTSGEDFGFSTTLGPPNDDFADAQVLQSPDGTASGTTAGGTRETDEPDHLTIPPDAGSWVGDHSAWYSWTAAGTGTTTVDACTGQIDSILAVYEAGAAFADLTRVTDNNNGADDGNCPGGTFGSFATFEAVGGTTYNFAVGDAGGARENTFEIAVDGPPNQPPEIAPLAPEPGAKIKKRKPTIKATVTDATQLDDEFMSISVDGNSRNLTYDPNTDLVTAKSQKLSKGRHTVVVTASDGSLEGEASWTFKVKKKKRN